jgi:hypothetical protein
MILGWAAMLIFALHACTHMVAAGDTWVAMACGRHFVNHGVDTVEPFSANSHRPGPTEREIRTWPDWAQWIVDKVGIGTVKYWHPTGWVNQNWLTHVIFYSLVPKSSYADGVSFSSNALVYWKFAIYILTVICVYYTGRLLGVNPALCAVFSCFAMFAGRSFLDIRPAGFSNMLVAVFLLILVLATYRNILYIWLIVPLTVFWCNVHGGYIYVFIMLAPFVALNLLTSLSKKRFRSIGLRGVCHTIVAGTVTFLAVIVFNPFHLTNLTHTFVVSVSEHAERWRDIHEWQSAFDWPNRVGTGFPFLVLYILSIGLLVLWLFSRFLRPRFLKAPKNELEAQSRLFTILSTILAYAASILGCWVIFVSFSLLGLDAASFFLCAIFVVIVMLSIRKNVHFIYLAVLLTLLALVSGNSVAGYGGRYIYPFIILPVYVSLHTLASLLSKTVKSKPGNIVFVVLTAVTSLLLMTVIFNPFKFEMPVWKVQQFFGLQRMWRPVYERNVELTYTNLFSVLYIVNIASVFIWLVAPYLRQVFSQEPNTANEQLEDERYQLPKIDLAVMTIAALTIYMAIRSRRFIPIAGVAACPIIAMFIDQIVRTISATRNFHKHNRLTVSAMPRNLQTFSAVAGAVAVLFFGACWGLKFKRVYLDPWPADPKLSSIFLRMTASDAKPFYALKFIKDNKIEGKMFNYWTEGGFIAWGQEPDPNTGRTPLQLTMDGRAQAAYDREAFDDWSRVMAGGHVAGQIIALAKARKAKITAANYAEIGQWMDGQLKADNVWVVLMPAGVFADPDQKAGYHAIRGLESNPYWRLVFFNNRQKLYVDVRTPRGRELFEGIFNGRTIYPDDYHRDLIRAHGQLMYREGLAEKKKGLDLAIKAFNLNPSPTPMLEIVVVAARVPQLRSDITKFCKAYFDEFIKSEDSWAKQDGSRLKTEAVRSACIYLMNVAKARKDTRLANLYAAKVSQYTDRLRDIAQLKRW